MNRPAWAPRSFVPPKQQQQQQEELPPQRITDTAPPPFPTQTQNDCQDGPPAASPSPSPLTTQQTLPPEQQQQQGYPASVADSAGNVLDAAPPNRKASGQPEHPQSDGPVQRRVGPSQSQQRVCAVSEPGALPVAPRLRGAWHPHEVTEFATASAYFSTRGAVYATSYRPQMSQEQCEAQVAAVLDVGKKADVTDRGDGISFTEGEGSAVGLLTQPSAAAAENAASRRALLQAAAFNAPALTAAARRALLFSSALFPSSAPMGVAIAATDGNVASPTRAAGSSDASSPTRSSLPGRQSKHVGIDSAEAADALARVAWREAVLDGDVLHRAGEVHVAQAAMSIRDLASVTAASTFRANNSGAATDSARGSDGGRSTLNAGRARALPLVEAFVQTAAAAHSGNSPQQPTKPPQLDHTALDSAAIMDAAFGLATRMLQTAGQLAPAATWLEAARKALPEVIAGGAAPPPPIVQLPRASPAAAPTGLSPTQVHRNAAHAAAASAAGPPVPHTHSTHDVINVDASPSAAASAAPLQSRALPSRQPPAPEDHHHSLPYQQNMQRVPPAPPHPQQQPTHHYDVQRELGMGNPPAVAHNNFGPTIDYEQQFNLEQQQQQQQLQPNRTAAAVALVRSMIDGPPRHQPHHHHLGPPAMDHSRQHFSDADGSFNGSTSYGGGNGPARYGQQQAPPFGGGNGHSGYSGSALGGGGMRNPPPGQPTGFVTAQQQLQIDAATRGGTAAAALRSLSGAKPPSMGLRRQQPFVSPLANNPAGAAAANGGGGGPSMGNGPNQIGINRVLGSVCHPGSGAPPAATGNNNGASAPQRRKRDEGGDSDDDASLFPQSLLLPDGTVPPQLKGLEPKLVAQVANEILESKANVGWDDIAGLQHAKSAVEEAVVWPLAHPNLFVGIRNPARGLLLFGPPGTGKTMIARAIASRASCTFFNISSSALMSKWVGEGEKLVRCLFAVAAVRQPAVIFIDEIDSLLSMRGEGEMDAVRRVKTEFLVHLDGVATSGGERVLVIGATNRPDELDEAARRRLEQRLYIPLPDRRARVDLLQRLMRDVQCAITPDGFYRMSRACAGFSGADLRSLAREAAMAPLREAMRAGGGAAGTGGGPFGGPAGATSGGPAGGAPVSSTSLRPVQEADLVAAMQRIRSSVGRSELRRYEEWNRTFGSFQFEGACTNAFEEEDAETGTAGGTAL
jgi:hypothetical protein